MGLVSGHSLLLVTQSGIDEWIGAVAASEGTGDENSWKPWKPVMASEQRPERWPKILSSDSELPPGCSLTYDTRHSSSEEQKSTLV